MTQETIIPGVTISYYENKNLKPIEIEGIMSSPIYFSMYHKRKKINVKSRLFEFYHERKVITHTISELLEDREIFYIDQILRLQSFKIGQFDINEFPAFYKIYSENIFETLDRSVRDEIMTFCKNNLKLPYLSQLLRFEILTTVGLISFLKELETHHNIPRSESIIYKLNQEFNYLPSFLESIITHNSFFNKNFHIESMGLTETYLPKIFMQNSLVLQSINETSYQNSEFSELEYEKIRNKLLQIINRILM